MIFDFIIIIDCFEGEHNAAIDVFLQAPVKLKGTFIPEVA
jgi:hypothetical protein